MSSPTHYLVYPRLHRTENYLLDFDAFYRAPVTFKSPNQYTFHEPIFGVLRNAGRFLMHLFETRNPQDTFLKMLLPPELQPTVTFRGMDGDEDLKVQYQTLGSLVSELRLLDRAFHDNLHRVLSGEYPESVVEVAFSHQASAVEYLVTRTGTNFQDQAITDGYASLVERGEPLPETAIRKVFTSGRVFKKYIPRLREQKHRTLPRMVVVQFNHYDLSNPQHRHYIRNLRRRFARIVRRVVSGLASLEDRELVRLIQAYGLTPRYDEVEHLFPRALLKTLYLRSLGRNIHRLTNELLRHQLQGGAHEPLSSQPEAQPA